METKETQPIKYHVIVRINPDGTIEKSYIPMEDTDEI